MKTKSLLATFAIFIMLSQMSFAQSTILGNVRPIVPAFLGWNGTGLFPGSLEIRNNFANQPINFFAGGAALQRGTILGTTGFWGVGLNFTTPAHLFDVRGGDINCGNGTAASPQGYMIGDEYVLRHKGDINNIFGGVGAGFFNGAGTDNAFFGTASGFANTAGSRNSFLGWHSGVVNDGANDNA